MLLKLRQERIDRNLRLDDVAAYVGVTKSTIHNIETNHRKPSYDVLVKLLDLFGYKDPRQLFAAVDDS